MPYTMMMPTGVPATSGPQAVRSFNPIYEWVADQDYRITGVTLDSTGAVLGNVTVDLFDTSTNAIKAQTVSDSATGAYSFFVNPSGTNYAVAYKAGSPDVAGTTVNTLVGV